MAKKKDIVVVDDVGEGEILEAKVYQTQSKFAQFMNRTGTGWLFMLPFLVLFVLFAVIPVLTSIRYCFTYYDLVRPAEWTGLENYRYMFIDDEIFSIAFKNTFVLAILTGPTGYILSFFFAWVINNLKYKSFWVLAFYTPTMVSGTAIGIIWMVLFDGSRLGYLNYALLRLGLIAEPIAFTATKSWIIPIIIIISLWSSLGGNFLIFFAGLQNVRKELYEAAAIDGIENSYQELWYITLPLMKPQLLYTAITSITGAFGVGSICVTVAGNPSPDYCVHTLSLHIGDYSGARLELGYACALSLVMFFITFTLGKVTMKFLSSKDEL